MTTAILGAGLTGCTLARLLAERGEEVVVLEAAGDYGGLCRSVTADGFTFDLGGSHIIFSRDEEVLAWMRDGARGEPRGAAPRDQVLLPGPVRAVPVRERPRTTFLPTTGSAASTASSGP